MSLPPRRFLLIHACLLLALVGVVSWLRYGIDVSRSELLSQAQSSSGDVSLAELEKKRDEALEKVRIDEGKDIPRRHSNLGSPSTTSQLATVKSSRCGSLCRARREIVKVKANLDSTANSVIRRLGCRIRGCSGQAEAVRKIPVHEFIQPVIQPLQPVVAQAVVQPIKRKSAYYSFVSESRPG